jgi:hypothetical protein
LAKRAVYSTKLVREMEKCLSEAFRNYSVRLTQLTKHADAYVEISSAAKRIRRDDGHEDLVIDVMTTENVSSGFLFGFRSIFEPYPGGGKALRDATLSIFQDLGIDSTPLFRAEWHQLGFDDDKAIHAQPHWHFVQSPKRIEEIIRMATAPASEEPIEFGADRPDCFNESIDSTGFHFAMGSIDKTERPFKYAFDTEEFIVWLRGLTRYVTGQIDYLVSHSQPVFSRPIEFRPVESNVGGEG